MALEVASTNEILRIATADAFQLWLDLLAERYARHPALGLLGLVFAVLVILVFLMSVRATLVTAIVAVAGIAATALEEWESARSAWNACLAVLLALVGFISTSVIARLACAVNRMFWFRTRPSV